MGECIGASGRHDAAERLRGPPGRGDGGPDGRPAGRGQPDLGADRARRPRLGRGRGPARHARGDGAGDRAPAGGPAAPGPGLLPTWETCVAGVVDTYDSITAGRAVRSRPHALADAGSRRRAWPPQSTRVLPYPRTRPRVRAGSRPWPSCCPAGAAHPGRRLRTGLARGRGRGHRALVHGLRRHRGAVRLAAAGPEPDRAPAARRRAGLRPDHVRLVVPDQPGDGHQVRREPARHDVGRHDRRAAGSSTRTRCCRCPRTTRGWSSPPQACTG